MADPRGFLTLTEREVPPRRPVELRLLDFKDVTEPTDCDMASRQASRCMDCGIPFCHSQCPLGNLIPEWNTLTWRRDYESAIERLHATNNFPDFTGRLCPAPCETACTLGINQPPVTIKNIEATISDYAFDHDLVQPQIPAQLTEHTVAVIGSGPSGLAVAQQLTRAGHTVAVYERADRIGGLLRYGIPNFKLEKQLIDRRLEQMRAEGTIFRTGVNVGVDISAEELKERYDAIVLAMGATVPRDLPIEGRGLAGVHQAMEYLPQATRAVLGDDVPNQISADGKDVVVIGGGDTGADCVATALRQGARSVTSLEIMGKPPAERSEADPWPTYPRTLKVTSASEEGGHTLYRTATARFIEGEGGQLGFLQIDDLDNPGNSRKIPAQLVLLAMGFVSVDRSGLIDALGLEVDERGRLVRDENWQSGQDGIFVAGDCGRGQSLVVWAIAEGRSVAASVDHYLRGYTNLPQPLTPRQMAYRP